jgi:hypothetical protein
VGLERGPLSLVGTTEELLGTKSSGSGLENLEYAVEIRYADHVATSVSRSWHYLRRQAAVARSVYFARGLRPRSFLLTHDGN